MSDLITAIPDVTDGMSESFASGIAVLIGLSQIKDAFGLQIEKLPADFFSQIHAFYQYANTANLFALLVTLSTLALIILWPKLSGLITRVWQPISFVPGIIVALLMITILVYVLDIPVETIGSRFGELPNQIPSPKMPALNWESAKQLFAPTLTIAILGAIESLLCARVGDTLSDDKHDPNQELMGQGIANMVVPFFGGLPVTGTIARTATNAKAGAKNTNIWGDSCGGDFIDHDHCSTFCEPHPHAMFGRHLDLHCLEYV